LLLIGCLIWRLYQHPIADQIFTTFLCLPLLFTEMNNSDILIIGGGAAGLMAGRILAKAGRKVVLLEARNRCGGRIHTLTDELFFKKVELGAEFVHGNLPVTLQLLKEAGTAYESSHAEMLQYKNGKFDTESAFTEGWDVLMDKLGKLKEDISIERFLQNEFPGDKYNSLKSSVRKFVSGYDTADTERASSFALRREWLNEDDDAQYRLKKGYGAMISYLEEEFKSSGGLICLNSAVEAINWQPGKVNATTMDGIVYWAPKILVALPLGVLQVKAGEKGAIIFAPPIPAQIEAINNIGFGAIIKILLAFDRPFWEDKETERLAGKSLKNMGFLLSDEEIPTWWTQMPQKSPVLTGWLGGPPAACKKDAGEEVLLQQSLQSLSNIFKRTASELKTMLVSFHMVNWTNEPFTRGSYAYDTVESSTAREVLAKPVEDTIFFAGEYLYDGPAMGTVEAALTSGKQAAESIIIKKN
jgi:monoamine oxidase